MTADVTPLVRIPTAQQIATYPQYTDGQWRHNGRNLVEFLAHHLGPVEAERLLAEADDIRRGQRFSVVPVKAARPRAGVDTVWTDRDGVDHDPIPLRQVTVCGWLIPPPFVYQPAGTLPCPDCFQGDAS